MFQIHMRMNEGWDENRYTIECSCGIVVYADMKWSALKAYNRHAPSLMIKDMVISIDDIPESEIPF
jgi:hypothetical protein